MLDRHVPSRNQVSLNMDFLRVLRSVMNVIEVVGGIICGEGKFLLGKRPHGKAQCGHWEFIGGKIEPGGTSAEIITRMNGDLK